MAGRSNDPIFLLPPAQQARVLQALDTHGPLSLADIWRRTGDAFHRTGVAQLVDQLELRGLVDSVNGKGRTRLCSLTPHGRRVLALHTQVTALCVAVLAHADED